MVGFATGGVVQLAWATTRPSLFWAVDSSDCMHAFDLNDNIGRPTTSVPLRPSKGGDADLPPPTEGEGEGVGEWAGIRFALDVSPPVVHGKARRMIALSCKRGGRLAGVEVHVLADKFAVPKRKELEHFLQVLESL